MSQKYILRLSFVNQVKRVLIARLNKNIKTQLLFIESSIRVRSARAVSEHRNYSAEIDFSDSIKILEHAHC